MAKREIISTDTGPRTGLPYSQAVRHGDLVFVAGQVAMDPATGQFVVLAVLLMVSMGLTGGLGHYLVARAYLWAPASVVSPFNYVQLLGAAVTGYLVFGDVPGPSLWLGAALIVSSGLFVLYPERRRA